MAHRSVEAGGKGCGRGGFAEPEVTLKLGRKGAWTGIGNELWRLFLEVTGSGHGNRVELPQTWKHFCFPPPPPRAWGGRGWSSTVLSASPQVWLWIITMNGYTGQMPSSQSSAASGSTARTPSWLLTANEVRILEQPQPALPLGLLSSPLSPKASPSTRHPPHPGPSSPTCLPGLAPLDSCAPALHPLAHSPIHSFCQ